MNNNQLAMNDVFVYAILMLVLIFGVEYFYSHNIALCNAAIMAVNKVLLYPFTWIPGSNAQKIVDGFHWNEPERYDWNKMVLLTSISGEYWRWPISLILFYWAWIGFSRSSIESVYQRSFSMRTLMQNNIKAFPCMAPVARRDILKMPLHEGPWRLAQSPLQFAHDRRLILDGNDEIVSSSLLINPKTKMANEFSPLLLPGGNEGVHLDKKKAIEILSEQVGDEFEGIDKLPDHIKGLAAAFMAFGMGDKAAGQQMLDQLSLSYTDNEQGNMTGLNTKGAEALLEKYSNAPGVATATQYHMAYISTWLVSLLIFARKKGVLACSQFIWLRPADRQMFYALNQVGGRRPWAETIGPWVHYTYEEMAKESLYEIDMADAADDLAAEIAGLGFVDEKTIPKRN
jgi:intracellular multiplication protein IcmP